VSKNPDISAEAALSAAPVLPVVVIDDASAAEPLARALLAGGLGAIEITLRTEAALEAIRIVAKAVPEMLVGAGTVLNETDLDAAAAAGARFALSPGATPKLLKTARDAGIPFIPGTATSSEVMRGLDLGYRYFKFFPAEQLGGVAAVKALAGPLPQARFCPTGGITAAQAPGYLALDNVLCVGGSWTTPADKIKARDWDAITALARQAAALKPVA
jgi:2-dehydro-3-deoxyphosphogluconate aldolase/(4S)-4-hydroxy-2-oxoglutarate aldolase